MFRARSTSKVEKLRLCLLCAAGLALSCDLLAETRLEGIDEPILGNVLALLRIDELDCDAPPRNVTREFDDAPAEIRSALEAYGFYQPDISSSLTEEQDCWLATFTVDRGEPVRLRDVDIELTGDATKDQEFDSLLARRTLTPGRPLLHSEYESLKSALLRLARQRGYVEAEFTASRIDVFPQELAADIVLEFASGPRYRFGPIDVEQNGLTDDLVLAYMGFEEGDYYDSQALADYQIELTNTGYFDRVSLVPQTPDRESKIIPLALTLQPAPRKVLSYGIGLSTDTGVRVRFARSIRRFNERGHQLNFNAQLSPVVSEVSAIYRMPYGDPRVDWLSFDAGGKREYTDTSKSRSVQFGTRRVRRLNEDWTRTQSASFLVEDFEVADQQGRSRLLMPGVEWMRLQADNALRPAHGSKSEFQVRGAAEQVGSDTSFVQINAKTKWIWSVATKGRVLTRGQIGATWEDTFQNLPPSVRFFAGGDESVRGYDFETLGPVDEEGKVVGGSRIFTASIEYEHQLRPMWSVAVFADTGNAFETSKVDLHSGVGIGARWRSPLGPIRVDVAKPLDGLDRGLRIHINLGPDL